MPAGWYPMPAPESPEAVDWAFQCVEGFGFAGRTAVLAVQSLTDALRLAASQNMPRRLRWVLLGDPPVAAVQAWAFLDLVPRSDPDARAAADAYERGATAAGAPAGDAFVWHREVTPRTVSDQPAVLIHDLLTVAPADNEPQVVQHRAVVALFPAEPVLISLTVSTPRLGALLDIEATVLAIAAAIRIGVPA